MSTGEIILIIIALLVFILPFVFKLSNPKGSFEKTKSKAIKVFTTKMPIDKAMKTIIQLAQANGYMVDDFDINKSMIILTDGNTGKRFEYFYPIHLTQDEGASVLIEVGIKNKFMLTSESITSPHERCFNGIRTAIYANE